MLSRIIEPADGALERMEGIISNPVYVFVYEGVKMLDYITELPQATTDRDGVVTPVPYPPGAIYVAQLDGTVVVAAPEGFEFGHHWDGWETRTMPEGIPTTETAPALVPSGISGPPGGYTAANPIAPGGPKK